MGKLLYLGSSFAVLFNHFKLLHNRYSNRRLFFVCFVCLRLVSCFPNVVSVSGFLIAPWVFSIVNLFVIKFRIDTLLKIIKQVNTSKQNAHIMLKSDASGNVISFCRTHVSRVTLKICFLSNTICNDKDHSI